MTGEPVERPTGRSPGLKLLLGCFGLALLMVAVLVLYIVAGHRAAVGPYAQPPEARP